MRMLPRSPERGVTLAELVVAIAILLVGLTGIHSLLVSSETASARLLKHSMASTLGRTTAEELRGVAYATWLERLAAGAGTWSQVRWVERPNGGYVVRAMASRDDEDALRLDVLAWWSDERPEALATVRRPAEATAALTTVFLLPPAPAVGGDTIGRARAAMLRDIPTPTPPPTPTPTPTPRATRGFGRAGELP